jgi:triosephosphate isomerase (TIM)
MLIAGNWKMNTDLGSATKLAEDVVREARSDSDGVDVAVCPPFISLDAVGVTLRGTKIRLGAQNMHQEADGAFTGEVSAAMLKSAGCTYVILGHSERRQYFDETDESVAAKVKAAMQSGLVPILCVGETLDERKAGKETEVVMQQMSVALDALQLTSAGDLVIAYEPVWAIGTGETATPEQAQEMHAFIRSLLSDRFGGTLAADVHILYGGSMKPSNAEELLSQQDVDGGLIGGASLKAADFAAIVSAARQVTAG